MSFRQRVEKIIEIIMVGCLAVMASAVFINVVLRYGFGTGIAASEELSRLLFVWLVFISATLAYPKGELMAFTMLLGLCQNKPSLMKFMVVIIRLLVILACTLLAWGAWQQFLVGLRSHSVVMQYPIALLPLPALLCSVAIGIMACAELVLGKNLVLNHASEAE